MGKRYVGRDVYSLAKERITYTFDNFERVYLSFSGGKDSSVMLHLVADEARKRGVKFGLLFVDLEAQYKLTIDHIKEMYDEYSDCTIPYWCSLPISLRNAVSVYEPKWLTWEAEKEKDWVRKPDKKYSITDYKKFPFYYVGMEFEEFVPKFGEWYAEDKLTACFVGIRSDESLNRYRTITNENKSMFNGKGYTTLSSKTVYNCYPIYDWRTRDIWIYNNKFRKSYNRLYDLMHKAGLTIHQQRICQPYGDDQRKGLWLFQVIEPETWSKVVARVNGANSGALYAQENGNTNGTIKITKPENHTWKSFSLMLLESMPEKSKLHYENKINAFIAWWNDRGFSNGIPDEADAKDENNKTVPSWRRICKSLLKNDYWLKGLSFTQNKKDYYEKYLKIMKNRRIKWGTLY